MTLFWGVVKGEYKPRLFDGENIREEDMTKELIAIIKKKEVPLRMMSTQFEILETTAEAIKNHYGISEIPKIIGSRTCEVTYYEQVQ